MGKLTVWRIPKRSFNTIFHCQSPEGSIALKNLRRRPDLSRWDDRFSLSLRVEEYLCEHTDCLPRPILTAAGDGLVNIPTCGHSESFIAHEWKEGAQPDPTRDHERFQEILMLIDEIASVPISLSASWDRTSMDDVVPNAEEFKYLLGNANLSWANEFDQLFVARKSQAFEVGKQSPKRIIGHRDISPRNLIFGRDNSISLIDWENVGSSTRQEEVGRAIIEWILAVQPESRQLVTERILQLVERYLGMPQKWWFSSWLNGHFMYTAYVLRQEGGDYVESDTRQQVQRLVDFAKWLDEWIT